MPVSKFPRRFNCILVCRNGEIWGNGGDRLSLFAKGPIEAATRFIGKKNFITSSKRKVYTNSILRVVRSDKSFIEMEDENGKSYVLEF